MKLRLLLFEKCNRNCKGCCNKDFDLKNLPIADNDSIRGKDMIILTGGEPMLNPSLIIRVTQDIKSVSAAPVIVYTAKIDDYDTTINVLQYVDGMTVTLHKQDDVEHLARLHQHIPESLLYGKLLRLNVFKGVSIPMGFELSGDAYHWLIKDEIEWIKNCPLPEGEVFMRLKEAY